ncbi:MAG: hypothetical protein OZ921_21790 [Sorangiineae bacterium]|nr:hypothetical protein [Polyangiaceae bacterium]MEB2325161.1 hypothetical protein [Sorangiineae bacterium]
MASSRRRGAQRARWMVGGAILAVLAAGTVWKVRADGEAEAAAASASALAALSGSPFGPVGAPALAASVEVAGIEATRSLTAAIADAKSKMADTRDQLDEGAAMLALWASNHLTWSELERLPETSPALFRKDPGLERGRRLCATGRLLEIRAESELERRMQSDHALPLVAPSASAAGAALYAAPASSEAAGALELAGAPPAASAWKIPAGGKVFFAVLTTAPKQSDDTAASARDAPPPLVLSVIAVASTGALVDGDSARVCGVLTGVNQRETDSGRMLTHRVVGMFDLPDNHPTSSAAK